jgi:hypothetical protein
MNVLYIAHFLGDFLLILPLPLEFLTSALVVAEFAVDYCSAVEAAPFLVLHFSHYSLD